MGNQPVTTTTPSILQVEKTDLRYLLNLVKNEIKSEINCHAVGTVQTFDPATGTCTVAFNYQKVLKKRNALTPASNSYTDIVIPYPVLIRVPVVFLSGGGAYTTYPISGIQYDTQGNVTYPGDTCILMFVDRDMDLWLELGNLTNPPNTERLHDISDAVALVGIQKVTKPINWLTNAIQTVYGQVTVLLTKTLASIIDSTGQRLTVSGMMTAYGGATAPSGWLLCQGQAVSRTTYAGLFTAIGTAYGAGDNSTTFNLPDLQGQVAAGIGGTLGLTLGQEFGEVTHTLTIPEMPSHTHPCGFPNTAQGGNNAVQGGGAGTDPTGLTGGDSPHNNVQPSLGVNWIIKI